MNNFNHYQIKKEEIILVFTLLHSNLIDFGRVIMKTSKKSKPIKFSNTFSNISPICLKVKSLSKPKQHGNASRNVPELIVFTVLMNFFSSFSSF